MFIILCLTTLAVEVLSTQSSSFVLGLFSNHPDAGSLPIIVCITTTESTDVDFVIEFSDGMTINGVVSPYNSTTVYLPETYVVSTIYERNSGVSLRTLGNKLISVSVASHFHISSDSYLALPLIEYRGVDEYTYFAVTSEADTNETSRVLIVSGYNWTSITITPTKDIVIPGDLTGGEDYVLEAWASYTVILDSLQTLLLESIQSLTGTKIVSDRPVTVVSGHQCALVPDNSSSCDYIIEQLPPTLNWGRNFIFPLLASRLGGTYVTVVASEHDTTADFRCTLISENVTDTDTLELGYPGNYSLLVLAPDDQVCSMTSNRPIIVALFSGGEGEDVANGDPLMIIVTPLEQYTTSDAEHSIVGGDDFEMFYVNVAVEGEPEGLLLNNERLTESLVAIHSTSGDLVGYAAQVMLSSPSLTLSVDYPNTSYSALVYAFNFSVGLGQMVISRLLVTNGM